MEQWREDVLIHYGVKGMKWGNHRPRAREKNVTGTAKPLYRRTNIYRGDPTRGVNISISTNYSPSSKKKKRLPLTRRGKAKDLQKEARNLEGQFRRGMDLMRRAKGYHSQGMTYQQAGQYEKADKHFKKTESHVNAAVDEAYRVANSNSKTQRLIDSLHDSKLKVNGRRVYTPTDKEIARARAKVKTAVANKTNKVVSKINKRFGTKISTYGWFS